MKSAVILVVLTALAMSAENGRKKRADEVELQLDTDNPNPSRADIAKALKKAEKVMEQAIKKVENPTASIDTAPADDEVEVPVRNVDPTQVADAKPKRRRRRDIRITITIKQSSRLPDELIHPLKDLTLSTLEEPDVDSTRLLPMRFDPDDRIRLRQ